MPVEQDNLTISNVSRETFEKVTRCFDEHSYAFLIEKWLWWNRSVNLMSRNSTAEQLRYHIIHSLLLLFESRSSNHDCVIDAGTGGGLPGLPMAIADPGMDYYLVDKASKKNLALKHIIQSLSLNNVHAVCDDIKNVKPDGRVRVVSKHAFHIPDLIIRLHNFDWTEVALLKGDDLFDELEPDLFGNLDIRVQKIENDYSFFHNKYLVSILNTKNKKSDS